MSARTSSEVRWDVIEHFQTVLVNQAPGSVESEITERTISLALSPKRQSPDQAIFAYDAWRNARSSVFRTKKRHTALVEKYASDPTSLVDPIDTESPESLFLARELEATIRQAVAVVDAKLIMHLECMLAEKNIAETCAMLDVSRSSVDRARSQIRNIARPIVVSHRGW